MTIKPWTFLLVAMAGRMNRQYQDAIAYLKEETITIIGRGCRLKDHAAAEPTPKGRQGRQSAESKADEPEASEPEACQE